MSERAVPNHSYIEASRVKGTAVYNRDGERLGTVEDIVLTKVGGEAVFAVLSFGGFLGMGDHHYPIRWSLLDYDTHLGGYVVNLTRSEIEGSPRYAPGAEVDWGDPVWGVRTNEDERPPVMDPVEGERRR